MWWLKISLGPFFGLNAGIRELVSLGLVNGLYLRPRGQGPCVGGYCRQSLYTEENPRGNRIRSWSQRGGLIASFFDIGPEPRLLPSYFLDKFRPSKVSKKHLRTAIVDTTLLSSAEVYRNTEIPVAQAQRLG